MARTGDRSPLAQTQFEVRAAPAIYGQTLSYHSAEAASARGAKR
jgi:hypothetical protein